MTTENNTPDGGTAGESNHQEETLTLEEAKSQIEKLKGIKNEAFKERDALKSRLKSFEDEKNQREQALLQEQGQFKELYEKAKDQINALQTGLKNKAVDAVLKEALQKAGARSVDTVSKLIDRSKIEVSGEDFQVNSATILSQIEELKKTDPVLFGVGEGANSPPVKRPADNLPSAGFESEMRAAKSQQDILAVMKKYGKI